MAEKTLAVSLGGLVITRERDVVITAYGIGACVAVTLYDPRSGLAGLLHAALPLDNAGRGARPGKYVDSGLTFLLAEMIKAGAKREQIILRLAGGSNMLTAPGFSNVLDIGRRNVAAVELVAAREGLAVAAADVGGNVGRTVRLYVASGQMTVQVLGQEPRPLGHVPAPSLESAPRRPKPVTGPLLSARLA